MRQSGDAFLPDAFLTTSFSTIRRTVHNLLFVWLLRPFRLSIVTRVSLQCSNTKGKNGGALLLLFSINLFLLLGRPRHAIQFLSACATNTLPLSLSPSQCVLLCEFAGCQFTDFDSEQQQKKKKIIGSKCGVRPRSENVAELRVRKRIALNERNGAGAVKLLLLLSTGE